MLHVISIISIIIGICCSLIILSDLLLGHKQKMPIMNVVWVVSGLYGGPLALLAYFKMGRMPMDGNRGDKGEKKKISWRNIVTSTLHCGSGCTVGDIVAESLLLLAPVTILGSKLAGSWTIDYICAFLAGIIFQYYSIKPMKHLSSKAALVAALKADTLSLTSWQIGMYGGMAMAQFLVLNQRLEPTSAEFWFVMQIAMILGFITSYPANYLLLKKGIKEAM